MNEERIFIVKPAVFPANNIEEQNSVIKLLDILDKSRIKPEATFMDKFPNTDGYITITDAKQYPIGKCEIQIKTLPDKNLDKPKHQCTLPFLSHCEVSLLPVILIVVNTNAETAYWMHFFRSDLLKISNKIKGKSVAVPFPKSNIISRSDKKYVDDWIEIITTYRQKKFDYERLAEKNAELEELVASFSSFPKPTHSITKDNLKSISTFIDTLNTALDTEFLSIKEILYNDYWKMSIVYSKFKKNLLSYALVPIRYGENDLLIREIDSMSSLYEKKAAKLISSYHTSNPIKDSPTEQAYLIIKNDTLEVIQNKYISLVNIPLSKEYIIDSFDRLNEFFPMLDFKEFNLLEIKDLLHNYVPLLAEEHAKMNTISSKEGILYFNISDLLWHTLQDESQVISNQAIQRYTSGDFTTLKVVYHSSSIDIDMLLDYVDFLYNQGIEQFERPYPAKDYTKPGKFVWNWYNENTAFEKIKFLYTELAITYNQFIEVFFPKLYMALNYNSRFDLQIIDLQYASKFDDHTDSPGVTLYNLKCVETLSSPSMQFFLNSKDCPMEFKIFRNDYKNGIDIDGVKYILISSSSGHLNSFFDDYTLKNNLYKLLEDRFKEYFANLTSNK